MVRVGVPSPLVGHCTDVWGAPAAVRRVAAAALAPLVAEAMAGDATQPAGTAELREDDALRAERGLARLAQAAQQRDAGAHGNPFGPNTSAAMALLPTSARAAHSCAPNMRADAVPVAAGDGRFCALRVALVAERNIAAGEPLTLDRSGASALPLGQRRRALQQRGHKLCKCGRCLVESGRSAEVSLEELRHVGNVAMRHGRYEDASAVFSIMVAREPRDGEAWHARGAAALEAGRWLEAHALFREGQRAANTHAGLSAQADKEAAYQCRHIDHHDTDSVALGPGATRLLAEVRCAEAQESVAGKSQAGGGVPFRSFLGGRAFLTEARDLFYPGLAAWRERWIR